MKQLIIPDIHHRIDAVVAILRKEVPDRVIFLGDWFDDFGDNEEISIRTAIWLSCRMDRFPEDIFLWGNHDTHYGFHSINVQCGGYSLAKKHAIRTIMRDEHWNRFIFGYFLNDNWLCTHAGLAAAHVPSQKHTELRGWFEHQQTIAQTKLKARRPHWMFEAGRIRGGSAAFGGVTWCDSDEFIPVRGLNQVFGHTIQTAPWHYESCYPEVAEKEFNNYCIDTNLKHYAVWEDGVFSIHPTPAF